MWFIHYFVEQYDGCHFVELQSEEDVIKFLNSNGGNQDFHFTVIRGEKMKFVPLSVATKYQRAP